jgi:hypothetical protein
MSRSRCSWISVPRASIVIEHKMTGLRSCQAVLLSPIGPSPSRQLSFRLHPSHSFFDKLQTSICIQRSLHWRLPVELLHSFCREATDAASKSPLLEGNPALLVNSEMDRTVSVVAWLQRLTASTMVVSPMPTEGDVS